MSAQVDTALAADLDDVFWAGWGFTRPYTETWAEPGPEQETELEAG
jgi:hypothetical protein